MNPLAEAQRHREWTDHTPLVRSRIVRQAGSATPAPRAGGFLLRFDSPTGVGERFDSNVLIHLQEGRAGWVVSFDSAFQAIARAKVVEACLVRSYREQTELVAWHHARTTFLPDTVGHTSIPARRFLRRLYAFSEHAREQAWTPTVRVRSVPAHAIYSKRLSELKASAKDDGINVQADSVREFLAFVDDYPRRLKRAHLFLLGDGTICAEWVGEAREVSLQFTGGRIEIAVLNVDKDVPETESWEAANTADECYAMLAEVQSVLEE